jgi:hypothetical protein
MNLVLDNTTLAAYQRCERYAFYRHVLHKTLPTVAPALNFGGVIHQGIAAWLKGAAPDEAIRVALSQWRPQDDDPWRTPDRVVEVLDKLFKQPFPTLCIGEGGPLVEVDFLVPLLTEQEKAGRTGDLLRSQGYEECLYAGIIDAVVSYEGATYVMDHKTTSLLWGNTKKGEAKYISPTWWAGWRPSNQMTGYLWGARHFTPVDGILINGIGVDAKHLIFERKAFNLTNEEIEEWRQTAIRVVETVLRAKRDNIYALNTASCVYYGKTCPYLQLCQCTPSARPNLLRMYKDEVWNPLTHGKEVAKWQD